MLTTIHYFLGPRHLATATFEAAFSPHSLAYFCPTCGDVWGRIMVEGGEPYWSLQHACCEKHSPRGGVEWGKIPGSFLTTLPLAANEYGGMWLARSIEHMPREVLEREVRIHTNFYQPEGNSDDTTNRSSN